MSLREFTDSSRTVWRVWDVAPEQLHPATRAEDYLQGFLDGWLVFEAVSGNEKRRLYPIPVGWESWDPERIEQLCRQAEAVGSTRQHRSSESAKDPDVRPPSGEPAPRASGAERVRSFLYPAGRVWSVAETAVNYLDAEGRPLSGPEVVLRFSSGRRRLELLAWPPDWIRYSDQQLAELLFQAFPREPGRQNATTHRRRRGDRPD